MQSDKVQHLFKENLRRLTWKGQGIKKSLYGTTWLLDREVF